MPYYTVSSQEMKYLEQREKLTVTSYVGMAEGRAANAFLRLATPVRAVEGADYSVNVRCIQLRARHVPCNCTIVEVRGDTWDGVVHIVETLQRAIGRRQWGDLCTGRVTYC